MTVRRDMHMYLIYKALIGRLPSHVTAKLHHISCCLSFQILTFAPILDDLPEVSIPRPPATLYIVVKIVLYASLQLICH